MFGGWRGLGVGHGEEGGGDEGVLLLNVRGVLGNKADTTGRVLRLWINSEMVSGTFVLVREAMQLDVELSTWTSSGKGDERKMWNRDLRSDHDSMFERMK